MLAQVASNCIPGVYESANQLQAAIMSAATNLSTADVAFGGKRPFCLDKEFRPTTKS